MVDFTAGFLSSSPAVDRPVVDKTGPEGWVDFDLPLSPDLIRRAVCAGDDPLNLVMDALSLLGLKLESASVPVEVLVIDSVSKPTENRACAPCDYLCLIAAVGGEFLPTPRLASDIAHGNASAIDRI